MLKDVTKYQTVDYIHRRLKKKKKLITDCFYKMYR